ncbi:hypothetical protein ACVIGB_008955 [Bradyrhizobium sp. USDA 4341]
MPAAEVAAIVTGVRNAYDMTKAMIGLRDAEAFRSKSIELQGVVLDVLEKAIAAREAQTEQSDRIRALEAEVASLKDWNIEKENYELAKCGDSSVAYMLKPDKRGSTPPHWLCPNCFVNGHKSFLNPVGQQVGRGWIFRCSECKSTPACWHSPKWVDAIEASS